MLPAKLEDGFLKRAVGYLGVACIKSHLRNSPEFLKQHSLLYDAIAVYDLEGIISSWIDPFDENRRSYIQTKIGRGGEEILNQLTNEIDYLHSTGFIVDTARWRIDRLLSKADDITKNNFQQNEAEILISFSDVEKEIKEKLRAKFKNPLDRFSDNDPDPDFQAFLNGSRVIAQSMHVSRESEWPLDRARDILYTRASADIISSTTNWQATSIEQPNVGRVLGNKRRISSDDLYALVLHNIPVPDAIVPWEDIFQFKAEAEQQKHLAALRLFISDFSKEKLTYAGAYEKIEVMLHDYEAWLKAARMKYHNCILKAVFVGALDAMKFAMGGSTSSKRLLKRFLDIRKQKATLLGSERKAPGRQLAYVLSAKQRFGHRQ